NMANQDYRVDVCCHFTSHFCGCAFIRWIMVKIGIVGVGHLGKIHLRCIREISGYHIAGIVDLDEEMARKVAAENHLPLFSSLDALLQEVDAVSIVTPTTTHYELAHRAIEQGKHVFIEKPVTDTSEKALRLNESAARHGVKVQVGHVERFNPALLALQGEIINPAFVEVHRLANYNPRSNDVSVIQDLMIHDLDILLHFIDSPIRDVRANGLSIISPTEDICNARIEFENGAVANVTASRISVKNMRKMRLFQSNAYISLDFLEKRSQVIRIDDEKMGEEALKLDLGDREKFITISNIEGPQTNAIKQEFESFYQSITKGTPEVVTLRDGIRALELAEQIERAVSTQGKLTGFLNSVDQDPS
ncbi:MAG TPA: Gfo/Idh/MocA family oxidoreductase, partial [Membranihabitans sp.]|nr:Gfo/Idh/MocA family oxidoreductase [Membranihabitans sp.]